MLPVKKERTYVTNAPFSIRGTAGDVVKLSFVPGNIFHVCEDVLRTPVGIVGTDKDFGKSQLLRNDRLGEIIGQLAASSTITPIYTRADDGERIADMLRARPRLLFDVLSHLWDHPVAGPWVLEQPGRPGQTEHIWRRRIGLTNQCLAVITGLVDVNMWHLSFPGIARAGVVTDLLTVDACKTHADKVILAEGYILC